jgi:arylsulfatase A-like enzyme
MYYRYYHYPQDHRVQPHYGVRDERWKLIYFNKLDAWELYDLQTDPHELTNLAADPVQAVKLAEMKTLLAREKKAAKDDDQFADEVPKGGVEPEQKQRRPAAPAPK